ncbi:hypothetical protein PQI66_00285 [Corynebacterium sp. USCH3]|uniref:hypothetical protein n=1 Tax=Corynebacterium sp. USCH3 TaxID=3024840 RepID=UPI0030B76243
MSFVRDYDPAPTRHPLPRGRFKRTRAVQMIMHTLGLPTGTKAERRTVAQVCDDLHVLDVMLGRTAMSQMHVQGFFACSTPDFISTLRARVIDERVDDALFAVDPEATPTTGEDPTP